MVFVTQVLTFANLMKLGVPYVEVLYDVHLCDMHWIQEHCTVVILQTSNTRNVGTNWKTANIIAQRNWLMLESTTKMKFVFKLQTGSHPTKKALLNQYCLQTHSATIYVVRTTYISTNLTPNRKHKRYWPVKTLNVYTFQLYTLIKYMQKEVVALWVILYILHPVCWRKAKWLPVRSKTVIWNRWSSPNYGH